MLSSRTLSIQASDFTGQSVVYVMSRDQRVHDNHALLAAQQYAHTQGAPLYVLFVLKNIPTRSREHYTFMLDGLKEVSQSLKTYGIPFILRIGDSGQEILSFAKDVDAGALFFDFSPLKGARSLVKHIAKEFHGSVAVIDTHNVIPVWVASDKKEFAAHTMRLKVHRHLGTFLVTPDTLKKQTVTAPSTESAPFDEAYAYIQTLPASGITVDYPSGEQAALKHLRDFIDTRLETYAVRRNDMSTDHQSGLSPYLHFGQISALRVAIEVVSSVKESPLLLQKAKLLEHGDAPSRSDGMNALLEEMIVRKELADNFCLFSDDYLSINAAPEWAQKSLAEHASDQRDFVYTSDQWEAALTHDDCWNAAQIELTTTGKIHGYMRMYWAKKLLEWSASPEEALRTAIYLNDKYSIDGGDPNGYVGILWSIAGLHDRPWFERPVYGKVRYMNDAGLRRKFDIDTYIRRVQSGS